MKVMSSQKIRIFPSPEQEKVFIKACGVARYTYNWALSRWRELKSMGQEKVYKNDLKKEWNQLKPDWTYESPKDANQQPFTNLYNAFKRFYEGTSEFPKKKKKGKCTDSFYVSNDRAHITNNHVTLPLVGRVRMVEPLNFKKKKVKIMSFTVSRTAGHWFVSVSFEMDDSLLMKQSDNGIIGVDVGLKTFAATSNDDKHISPKPLKKFLKKLKKEQRGLSRKKKISYNRSKAKKRVAKVHARVANIRKDFLHKLSHKICKENMFIVAEDLNVKGLLKNHKLAFHIADAGWGEFNRQLEYKSKRTNSIFIKADRWFASSKTCSECGYVKDHIGLDEREFICEHCGMIKDRDLNAAINLLSWGLFEFLNIPGASGKFTPVEIVALARQVIAELTTVCEATCDLGVSASAVPGLRDNQSFRDRLRNKVESQDSIKKSVNTILHNS